MDSERDRYDQDAPEVVNTAYPEVVQYPFPNNYQQHHHQQHTAPKPEDGTGTTYTSSTTPYSTYGSHIDHTSPRAYHASTVGGGAHPGDKSFGEGPRGRRKGGGGALCGCGTLVVVLGAIIAVLTVAVVGLAAGTGVEASRANTAEAKVRALSGGGGGSSAAKTVTATTTVGAAAATGTSFAELDDNCSGNPGDVSGTTYNAFSLIGNQSFTIRCNADAVGSPLLSLFTSNINTCMDVCASYSSYTPTSFGSNNSNTTCGGVSFIPLWTNKTAALEGGAPGNCYLKPTQTASPNTPNIGTECHAGILVSS